MAPHVVSHRGSTPGASWRSRGAALLALVSLAACAETPSGPVIPGIRNGSPTMDVVAQVFTSGSHVRTWDPILPASGDPNWPTTICTANPQIGLNANWVNPHNAFVLAGHPWAGLYFSAPWINAYNSLGSIGPLGQSWTRYETPVSGNGSFVISLLADNCSWIYLDGTLVGVQPVNHNSTNTRYGLTLNGTHTLTFIIFDGGGANGGKFRLETTTNPPPPLNPDLDGDGHLNGADAFPLDPTEWADTDHDGVGDNKDAYPNDPTRSVVTDSDADGLDDVQDNCPAIANPTQADLDADGVGDACDSDIDGDGVANAQDAFPTNPAEWADSDGDGVGDHADAFPLNPAESVDTDHDGVGDNGDNCRVLANSSQADMDHDGIGDACDPDIDGDGVSNAQDAFPTNPAEWADSDGDGVGDNGDAFPRSNTGPQLVVGDCSPGVANWRIGGGTFANDLIESAYASAPNHGGFVSAVANLADGWKKAGRITGQQQGAIVSCAARMK